MKSIRFSCACFLAATGANVLVGAFAGAVAAATFHVDSNRDEGQGSYREAIEVANLSPGPHQIYFEEIPGGVITVREPVPVISSSVEFIGLGQTRTVLDGQGLSRVIRIAPVQLIVVTLRDLTLRNGTHQNEAGCSSAFRVALALERIRVTACSGRFGGGVSISGESDLKITHSRVDHNTATFGGAGLNTISTPVRIIDSEFDHNLLAGGGYVSGGGASISGSPDTQITRSYFHHNSAQTTDVGSTGSGSVGGGLYLSSLTTTIDDTTFSSNAALFGAAIGQSGISGDPLYTQIIGSTFVKNVGSSTVESLVGTLFLAFSTVTNARPHAGSGAGRAISTFSSVQLWLEANVISGNYGGNGVDVETKGRALLAQRNYICSVGAGSIDAGAPGSNIFGNTPKLGPLRWQGGPTPTVQPLPDSPLIDSGNTSGTPFRDQRGFKRIVGPAADIGAVERDPDRISFGYFESGPVEE